MKSIVLGLVLALAALPAARAAEPRTAAAEMPAAPVLLKPSVQVTDAYVRLGDLFENAGTYADRPVLTAPEPGRQVTVDAAWLYKVARTYGLSWRPLGRTDRAVIERPGQSISEETVLDHVRDALRARGMPADNDIQVASRSFSLSIAADAIPDIALEGLSYEERAGRFSVTVVAPANAPNPQRLRLQGRVVSTVEVPMLARAIKKGEVITSSDLRWAKLRAEDVRQGMVVDADALLGKSATRFLREGTTVKADDVREPVLITKGKAVTVLLTTPMMTLTVQGKALEDGTKDATIKIENVASKKTMLATVIDENTVAIRSLATVAAAN